MNQTSKLNLDYFDVSWRGYTEIVDRNVSLFCETNPIESNSHGIWERMSYKTIGMRFWEYPLPNLEIIMFSTYALWRLIDKGFNRIGFRAPRFTYMMIAGVIIGQTCHLSNNSWLHGIFFPDDHRAKAAETLGAFSFLLYWFLKGVTMDVGVGLKMGRKAVVIGLTTTLIPLICGNIMLKRKLRGGSSLSAMEFRLIIFMQSVSPFTSIDTLLKDLKIKHSEFGRIALAGAMVTDVLAFGITWMNAIHWDGSAGLVKSIYAASFFTFLVYVVRPSMIWVVKQTPEGRPVKDAYIYTILGLAFLSFKFFEWIHYFGATGPFVFGLSVPEGYPMGSTLVQKFESFNLGAILPLFVSMTMTQVDFLWLFKECGNFIRMEGKLYEIISFIFVMTLTKVFASIIAARTFKMPLRDSIALALVYSSKGIFELSYYTFAVEIKRIRPEVFTILATFILVNSIFIPLALELVHDPTERFKCYRKRNLAILKDGAELPCLVCIYKPDHISSMTNVLTDINPSRDSPMACNVLHLIELVGQANPMFISHQLQKPEPGSTSCSDTVINSFRKFHQNFYEYTALNIFTSISMSKHMHEDICWLALSKSLSLILLPFHRTWSADRATVSNDDKLRMINLNVLKRAPCSVGIFICRKPIESHTIQNKVCLIFNGGKDDKEALVIAKRMRLNQKGTSLTIIRFVPKILKQDNQELEAAFPMVSLEETVTGNIGSNVKENDDENVTYIDKAVADGSETSRILREMRNDFDLFIVGKGSGVGIEATSGLGAWTEFEELGPLGDLLASHEYISRASVLVVKTQEYVHQTKGLKQKYN